MHEIGGSGPSDAGKGGPFGIGPWAACQGTAEILRENAERLFGRRTHIELRAGGLWYEVGEDGSEASEATSLHSNRRRGGCWHGALVQYRPELLTEVEVRFPSAKAKQESNSNTGAWRTWATDRSAPARPSKHEWSGIIASFARSVPGTSS